MASPIGRIPSTPRIMSVAATRQAADNQAKVTGGGSDYTAQANLQAVKGYEDRRRAAMNLIGKKGTTATLAALTRLPDMSRSRAEGDEGGNSDEDERDSDDEEPEQPQHGSRRAPPPFKP